MARIEGSNGDDLRIGTSEADQICGYGAIDQLRGDAGNDRIEGGSGPDSLYGDRDDDTILGGDGDDLIRGGRCNDTVDGGAGADMIRAEVRLATWDEFDLGAMMWTIPDTRMKAQPEHRVPLCGRAVEILREAGRLRPAAAGDEPTGVLFPSRRGKALSEAGSRSSSRCWGSRLCHMASGRAFGTGLRNRRITRGRSSRRRWRMWFRIASRRPTTAQTCSSAGDA